MSEPQQTPPQPLQMGDVVAQRYEVVRELGRGGMGVVYLCDDRVSGEKVALKCVFFDSSSSRERDIVWFQQEVRALAALDHPAIVHARDFGVLPDGSPYLVMDALGGRSIHVWKYLCTIPWPVTWSVVDQVLGGLAHAHARGIVHGDLKPSNVMIDPRGGKEEPRAYVLDLGLAWLLADHTDPRLVVNAPGTPTMPFGLGTPGWMAPEQIRNAAPHIGPPTDLYALGSILFELLTKREVFEGATSELLRKHRDEAVASFEVPAAVPPGVVAFVLKLLAKCPWHRYAFAAEAREAWAAFKPPAPVRWQAPNVRVGDEPRDATVFASSVPAKADVGSLRLAPGLLSLRPSPLVGRNAERQLLWTHAKAVGHDEGPRQRFCTLRGEAGVGKSRLAEWLCEAAHEAALLVPLRVRYRKIPGPLDGMRGALLTHYNLVGQTRAVIEQALLNEWEVSAADDDGRTWVAAAATYLCPDLGDDTLGPSGKRFVLDKPALRFLVVRHVLERIATGSKHGVLLWLDDLHLGSATSFAGFADMANSHDLRLFFVATARDEALAANPQAVERLSKLAGYFHSLELPLSRLDDGETRGLLAATLPLSREAEASVVARSRGNPLFALQLVHAWASGGYLTLDGDRYTVPPPALRGRATTTAELFNARLAALDPSLIPSALGASALGEVFRIDVFERVLRELGLDARASLEALGLAEILLLERGQRLRWPHALMREHVYAKLLDSPDAASVFRAAARALGEHPEADSRRIVRQRVINWLQAGDDARAAEVVFPYVARSWARGRDVSSLRSDLALLEGHVSGKYEAHHKRWKAETERHAGRLAEARSLAEEARRMFTKAGDALSEAHCLRLLAHIASDQGAPGLGRIEGVLARATFESIGHDQGTADCHLVLGEIDYLLGDHERSRAQLAVGAALFEKTGDMIGRAQCLIVQGLAAQSAGELDDARTMLARARAVCDEIGYQLGLAQTEIAIAHVDHRAGNVAAAYELAVRTRARFRTLDNPRGEAASERLAAMSAFARGDLVRAREHAEASYTIYDTRIADPWGRVEGLLLVAQCGLAAHDVETADRALDAALAIPVDEAEPVQHRHLTAAWRALEVGRHADALDALVAARASFAEPTRTGDHTITLLPFLVPLAAGTQVEVPLRQWLELLRVAPPTSANDDHNVGNVIATT